MVDAGGGEERIADLLRQWQESPTPRVGLQLAEEHRRLGRHADARAVLERSLEAHPGHLSSLVALGKTLLDLGEADAAAAQFQRVVERDPTHLVAGKQLIEAHLRRDDGPAARERLDLYRLLNEGDPEIEELEERWRALAEAGEGEPSAEPVSAAEPGEDATEEEPEPFAEPPAPAAINAAEPDAAPGPEDAEPEPVAPAEPAAARADSAAVPALDTAVKAGPADAAPAPAWPQRVGTGAAEPFGALAGAGDQRRWLAGLAGGGIFPVELPPESEPEPEAAVAEGATELESESEAAVAEEAVEAEPVAEEVSAATEEASAAEVPGADTLGAAEPEPSAPEMLPAAAAEAPAERATRPAAPVKRAAAASVHAVAGAAAPAERATRPAAPVERAAAASVHAVAGAAAPAAAPAERATNTLGELYLVQGHLADAERVFRAVLARRPDDPAACAGLAEVERRRAAPLSAGELLEWARGRGERLPEGGERRERSAVLLRTYLARLRRRSSADVS